MPRLSVSTNFDRDSAQEVRDVPREKRRDPHDPDPPEMAVEFTPTPGTL